MRISLVIATIAASLFSGSTVGMSRNVVSYVVQRMWSDSSNIYVVYNVRRQSVAFSLSDIDGTITSRTDKVQLLRVSRDDLARSNVIKLETDDNAAPLVYRDSEFELSQTKQGAVLTVNSSQIDIPPCAFKGISTEGLRSSLGLFYCGAIYDTGGKVIWRLPTNAATPSTSPLLGTAGKLEPLKSAASRFVVTLDGESIALARVEPLRSSEGLTIRDWSISDHSEHSTIVPLGGTETVYLPQDNAMAYSPSRIVLRPTQVEDRWILLCTKGGCRKVMTPWAYSYVIVDERTHRCIFFRQQDVTKPTLEYQAVPL